jgi:hypothetical protein
MPRRAREWTPGTYHVYCRGNRKQNIFMHDDDRRKYLISSIPSRNILLNSMHTASCQTISTYCSKVIKYHSIKSFIHSIPDTQSTLINNMILSAIYSMGDLGLLTLIQLLTLSALASTSTLIQLKRASQTLRKLIPGAAVLLTLKNSTIP